ncbi:MAG: ABC transporter permease [Bacteroidales bacterium]|nr:ABC transporter permease [Bacteroidales bacterium]
MNWNAFVTSYRFILKSKIFTVINLTGLTAGLTVSFFLLIYIINELSFNSNYSQSDRIFRIIKHTEEATIPSSPALLPDRLREVTGGIRETGALVSMPFMTGVVAVKKGENFREEPGFFAADPSILDILNFRILAGEGRSGLENPGSVVLSQTAARNYFGEISPVGKKLVIQSGGIPDTLTVTGVFKDLPWNSTLQIDFIAGIDLLKYVLAELGVDYQSEAEQYRDDYSENYILVDHAGRIPELMSQLPALQDTLGFTGRDISFSFQNIRDIHLESEEISNDFHQKGTRSALFYYGSLAFAILLLAGINYSILSTARSAMRFKEIGVRKVLGATKRELRVQVLTESILLTSLALPLSFLVLGFVEPFADKLYGYNVQLYTWNMLIYIPLFALITLIIGVISGGYLAVYLSALNPLKALKNQIFKRQRFSLSKIFIILQLLITLFLLGCVLIIFSQLNYCLTSNSGILKKNLLIVSFNPGEFQSYPELRDRIREESDVLSVSGSSMIPPTNDVSYSTYVIQYSDTLTVAHSLEKYFVDEDFFNTLGIGVLAGEDIMKPDTGQSRTPVILNQAAEKLMHLPQPVGTSLGTIIITGIVRDFNIHSLHSKITPAVFIYDPSACKYIIVRCKPGSVDMVREAARNHWNSLAPGLPFNSATYDDELNQMYSHEQQLGQMVASFSFLAFLITGMGLFGLALLMIERRLKEIAVRKIFGASNNDILFRMQKEFLIYLLFASLISVPITWYVMSGWLSSFYYRVPMHWYLFVIAILGITIFVSSIITIRTWIVLRKNLINVLKYE